MTPSLTPKRRLKGLQLVLVMGASDTLAVGDASLVDQLAATLKAAKIQPQVPSDAPPDVPRIVLQGNDTAIAISRSRLHLTVTPPTHVQGDSDGALAFLVSRLGQVEATVGLDALDYRWSGLVVSLEYPRSTEQSALDVVTPLFDELVKIPRRKRPLASMQLQFGFTERGFHRNFVIGGYETKDLSFNAPAGSFIEIDASQLPVRESGISLQVDVNNRPRAIHKDLRIEVDELVGEVTSTVANLSSDLGMEWL